MSKPPCPPSPIPDPNDIKTLAYYEEKDINLAANPVYAFMLKNSHWGDLRNRVNRLYVIRPYNQFFYEDYEIKFNLDYAIMVELKDKRVILIGCVTEATMFFDGFTEILRPTWSIASNKYDVGQTLLFSPECKYEFIRNLAVSKSIRWDFENEVVVEPTNDRAFKLVDTRYIIKRMPWFNAETKLRPILDHELSNIVQEMRSNLHIMRSKVICADYARRFGNYYSNALYYDPVIKITALKLGYRHMHVMLIKEVCPAQFAEYVKTLGDLPKMKEYKEYAYSRFAKEAKYHNVDCVGTCLPTADLYTYEYFVQQCKDIDNKIDKESQLSLNTTMKNIVLEAKHIGHAMTPEAFPYYSFPYY
jgi:hypothetical protein